jgi:hypothetical protein
METIMKVVYNVCPNTKCGRKLDGATDPISPTNTPTPGDVSICIYCESFITYDETMTLQLLNPDKESPTTMLGLNKMLEYIREFKLTREIE